MAKGLCLKCLNYGFNCKHISSNPDVEITVCGRFLDISKGPILVNLVKTTDESKREVNNKTTVQY
jgi:hypothetical protein